MAVKNMTTNFGAALLASLILVPAISFGQSGSRNVPVPVPSGGSATGGSASTAYESFLRGQARRTLAQGQAALSTSQALNFREDARQKYLQNRVDALNARIEVIRARDARLQALGEYRKSVRATKLTPGAIVRIQRARVPGRLSSSAFDPATGSIMWPAPLRESQYQRSVAKLDALFARWAREQSGTGSETYLAIKNTLRSLRSQVAASARDELVDAQSYFVAKRFVDSLTYEAQRPMTELPIPTDASPQASPGKTSAGEMAAVKMLPQLPEAITSKKSDVMDIAMTKSR